MNSNRSLKVHYFNGSYERIHNSQCNGNPGIIRDGPLKIVCKNHDWYKNMTNIEDIHSSVEPNSFIGHNIFLIVSK